MNVIVIMMDTLRRDFLGCYGNPDIRTPAMDAFARRATIFESAYTGSFPTVPMRKDCFTGFCKWPIYGWTPMTDEEVSVTDCLNEAGYHTGLVMDTLNMVATNFPRGFDDFELIAPPEGHEALIEQIEMPWPEEYAREKGRHYIRDLARTAHYRHETDWAVAQTMLKAGEWLEDNYKRDKFFLWVDTFEIHENWQAPDYLTEMYSPNYQGVDYSYPNYGYTDIYKQSEIDRLRARYAAEVTLTDHWVGYLLRQIEEMGLLDNTLVVLISDHGMYLGEHERMGKHAVVPEDAWPLYREVAALPLIVHVPGLDAPRRVGALAQPADLFATIIDAAGARGTEVFGKSWLPLLRGEVRKNWDYVFTSRHCGDGPGAAPNRVSHINVYSRRWSLTVGREPFEAELHDLKTDSAQQSSVIQQEPAVAQEMLNALRDFMREVGAAEEYIQAYARM